MPEVKPNLQLDIADLPINPVDTQSPVPLYHQITLDLRRMIVEQILPPGATLPPEVEICQVYGVGRQTIRRAIARLVDENLVERYAGRGTFIRDLRQRGSFHLDRSFSQHIKDLGMQPHSKSLCQEEGTIDEDAPHQLQKHRGKPCLYLERVRYGDQDPICYQSTTVLTEGCDNIADYDFGEESLYSVLANQYGLIITRIDHLIRAVAADDYRAELLEIQPGEPLLLVITTARLQNGDIIEITYSHYRADRYEYRTSEES